MTFNNAVHAHGYISSTYATAFCALNDFHLFVTSRRVVPEDGFTYLGTNRAPSKTNDQQMLLARLISVCEFVSLSLCETVNGPASRATVPVRATGQQKANRSRRNDNGAKGARTGTARRFQVWPFPPSTLREVRPRTYYAIQISLPASSKSTLSSPFIKSVQVVALD